MGDSDAAAAAQKHYGNGAPSFLVEANIGQKIDVRNPLQYEIGYDRKGFFPFGRNRKATERDISLSAGTGVTAGRSLTAERGSFGRKKLFRSTRS